jgi:hypothetical protein
MRHAAQERSDTERADGGDGEKNDVKTHGQDHLGNDTVMRQVRQGPRAGEI